MRRLITISMLNAVVLFAGCLTGCVFSSLEQDLLKLEAASFPFSGTVTTGELEFRNIVVVAMADTAGERVVGFSFQYGISEFEMLLPAEQTYFFAYNDVNQDLRFQATEPFAWSTNAYPADPARGSNENIVIEFDATSDTTTTLPTALVDKLLSHHINTDIKFSIGTVTSLDNPWFSEERAKIGLWEPYAFMAEGGTGIHFVEPYDPKRTPVLFVHGINGSPQDFSTLIDSLDTDAYQAWVFSYPSGLPLDWLASGMAEFLEILHSEYAFDGIHIIAHSMGGLVSRGGVNLCIEFETCEYLRSYVTISTPWNGVESAQSGVKWAPTVVPVWRDLDPTSEYVTTLFATPLPDSITHYLLFGFRQDTIFDSDSSDGVIKLTSQLRHDAQIQATLVRGYDEDHVSILANPQVIDLVKSILDSTTTPTD
jgi:pimeloyl-ACP methyl ester carboxylesterase